MIDDRGNFRVWIDLNELGPTLIPFPNVDEMLLIRQVRLFEHGTSPHMVLLCRRCDLGS